MSSKTGFHQRLLDFLQSLVENRLRHHQGTAESDFFFDRATVRAIRQSEWFAAVFKQHPVGEEEVLLVLLALVPHLSPGFYSRLVDKLLPEGGDFPEFGGVKGTKHRGILPTGETALFLLAGDCMDQRLQVQQLLRTDSWLLQRGLLRLEAVKEGEPTLSGRLLLDEEAVELLTVGRISPPSFSSDFAAEHLSTEQEWADLVLNPGTARQIQDIQTWLAHNDTLLHTWGMRKKIKPGYRALFYGPPGTGKTLTAALLGKYTGREVFRIDLSLIVSKYIGETEKNLSKIFAKAQHKDWILFFDEADALFGKRTNVRDAHDKYANQEVSYLLQRVEHYPGVIILASNLKTNIDDAFVRRFHAIIHFPKPTAEERLLLWQKAIPKQLKLAKDVDLPAISQKYDLTGSSILNVTQRFCLDALAAKSTTLSQELLLSNIRKEYEKEGRMA